jgi:hypothetical protein
MNTKQTIRPLTRKQAKEALETMPLDALLGRRHGVSFECLPLNGKAALQLTDLLLTVLQALFEVSDVGDHDAAPWQSSIAGIKGLMLLEMAMLDF